MWKNKFETDFNDDGGNSEANVSLDVEMPNEINEGRDKDGDGNPGIIHGFDTRGREDGRFEFPTSGFQIVSEEIFESDRCDEHDKSGDGIIGGFWEKDFFDRFNDNVDSHRNDDKRNDNSGDAFDNGTTMGEAMMAGEFFANDNEKTRNRINKAM